MNRRRTHTIPLCLRPVHVGLLSTVLSIAACAEIDGLEGDDIGITGRSLNTNGASHELPGSF